MNKAYIDPEKCDCSTMCSAIKACYYIKAISQTQGAPVVDPEKCIGCGICVKMCPSEAITLKAF